jgi:ABC-type transport system substrate-binding protein
MVYLAMNTQQAPFDDPTFRQAVAHAIDYQAIATQLYGGRADVLAGLPFIPGGEVDDPSLRPYPYDPERSKALLAAAGKDGAGFVLDTHGDYNTLGQAIAQALGKVGLKVEVRQWEWAALQAAAQKGERAALVATFGNASLNPLWAYWVAGAGQPANYSQYSNETFDGLMKRAPAIVDPAERAKTFREAYAISYRELPQLTLLTPRVVEAARKNVTGWVPSSAGRVNLHRVDLERR